MHKKVNWFENDQYLLGDQTNLKKMVNLKVNGKERTLEAGIRKG